MQLRVQILMIYLVAVASCFVHITGTRLLIGGIASFVATFIFFSYKEKGEFRFLILLVQVLFVASMWYTASPFVLVFSWVGLLAMICIHIKYEQSQHMLVSYMTEREGEMLQDTDVFRSLRIQRHDFLKHAHIGQYLLEEKKYEEARTYFAQLLPEYKALNTAIQGEAGHIAALLLQYQKRGEGAGIAISYELQAPLSHLPMRMVDQTKLLGNLFENSIEAATSYGAGATFYVKTAIHSGIYILEVTNHTEVLPKEQVDGMFTHFHRTTKRGHHEGMGTYIIATLVKRYNGILSYTYNAPMFYVKLKIPLVT